MGRRFPGGSVPLRFTPYPPTVSCVLASRELVSGGPLPLPVAEGGHAPGNLLPITSYDHLARFGFDAEVQEKEPYFQFFL